VKCLLSYKNIKNPTCFGLLETIIRSILLAPIYGYYGRVMLATWACGGVLHVVLTRVDIP